ncbi:hypothetical protein [Kitasatospora sp. NPDC094015]|uniref:hypothetical protein n=1 Tax=Kitasatospora sp. NPDC094015 TaxID=3155205 RepID=UPI00331AB367
MAGGHRLDRALFDALPAGVRATLRRCATVPRFGPELFDTLLCPPGGPPLLHLLERRQVEHVPQTDGGFRIAAPLRQAAWESWWGGSLPEAAPVAVDDELLTLARALADHYRTLGQPVDELRQLLLSDPTEALRLFETEFAAADAGYDLARGQDLVEVVSEDARAFLVSGPLARARQAAALRLRARDLWRMAHNRSARYLARPAAEAPLLRLLEDGEPRLLRLWATAGTGKTMLLNWFTARHCMELRPPVPCARVDFDTVDAVQVDAHPWLLLAEFAGQLDRQLPGSPFHEFLSSVAEFDGALDPPDADEPERPGRAALVGLGDPAATAAEVESRFATVLHEAATERPVVLILDTLEELALRTSGGARALGGLLRRILDAVPSVRLVLSGRYEPAEKAPGLATVTEGMPPLRLDAFTDEEADRYLGEVRAVRDERLRAAIVRASGGLPFTLALYADLAPRLTPDQVVTEHGPGLLYAIDRVLERIEDDRLRWILRYGVVPRRLTFEFLRDVMAPRLARALRAEGDDDRPELDRRPVLRRQIFLPQDPGLPTAEDGLRELWDDLTAYASDVSWLHWDEQVPHSVVVHPAVREPLRRLIADHAVHRLLHRDAAAYYHRLSEEDRWNWPLWRVEELYHHVHLGDQEDILTAWRAAVADADSAGRPEWAVHVARELLGDGFGEEAGTARSERVEAAPRLVLGEAHLVLAGAAHRAALGGDRSSWRAVLSSVLRAEELAGALFDARARELCLTLTAEAALRIEDPSLFDDVVVRAGAWLAADPATQWPALSSLLSLPTAPLVLFARNALRTGRLESVNALLTAAYQDGLDRDPDRAGAVAEAAVTAVLEAGRVDLAEDWGRILHPPGPGWAQLGRIRLAGGAFEQAVEVSRAAVRAPEVPPGQRSAAAAAAVGALLALRRPREAARLARARSDRPPAAHPGFADAVVTACETEAAAAAAVGDTAAAIRAWDPLRRHDDLALAHRQVRLAELQLRLVGDRQAARKELGEAARRGATRAATALHTDWLLASAEAADPSDGERDDLFRTVREVTRRSGSAALLGRAALAGLALQGAEHRDAHLADLVRALAPVPGASARLAALTGLARCPGPWQDGQTEPLWRALGQDAPRPLPVTGPDDAALGLTLVELLRLGGRRRQAAELLNRCAEVLLAGEPLVLRDRAAALARLGLAAEVTDEEVGTLLAAYPDNPVPAAELLVIGAETGGGPDQAQRALDLLADIPRPSALLNRAHAALPGSIPPRRGRGAASAPRVRRALRYSERHVPEHLVTAAAPPDPAPSAAVSGPGAELGREITVRIDNHTHRPADHELAITVVGPNGRTRSQPTTVREQRLDQLLAADPDPAAVSDLPQLVGRMLSTIDRPLLVALLVGAAAAAAPVAAMAAYGLFAATIGRRGADVRLAVGDQPLLARLPWEDGTLGHAPLARRRGVRYVYRDGPRAFSDRWILRAAEFARPELGPDGTARLARSLEHHLLAPDRDAALRVPAAGGGSPLVDLGNRLRGLRPDRPGRVLFLHGSDRTLRASRSEYGPEPWSQYRSADWELLGVGDRDYLEEAGPAARRPADLVHVRGPMVAVRGAAAVDLAAERRPPVLAEELCDLLGGFLVGRQPLIVLEVPPVGPPTERARQLLLRNELAHRLLADGRAAAVLALGPFRADANGGAGGAPLDVAASLAGNSPRRAWRQLANATARISRPADGSTPEVLPALFSHLPPDLLVPLGVPE